MSYICRYLYDNGVAVQLKKSSRWRINAKTIVDIIKYDQDNPFKVLDVGALK
jgi:hypothetical protein